ncbi:MAG: nucleotidyltransferase family protein [Candidatus Thiosymbion ectosymbiont of Robbea hypermnestra]|nr:nucleotidyltransferase family protein [Candidatus Thiosymbion ectosymbiont of Robbea hypermnestra]
MAQPTEILQHLLLDLLSTRRTVAPGLIARLGGGDWRCIMEMAYRHRLHPMLHWRFEQAPQRSELPKEIVEDLATNFANATRYGLLVQRELLLVHRRLEAAKIPHIFLKGAFLAFFCYPNPALRPLRDLDILVPKTMAVQAFEILHDAGYLWSEQSRKPTEDAMEVDKHLPPLWSPETEIHVEIHIRLFVPEGTAAGCFTFSDESALWQRRIHRNLMDTAIPFLCATDLLLHLILHGAYDHHFGNGPLLFSDIAYLLEKETIDWPLFWQLARDTSSSRGCLLVLGMVERYFGAQLIQWPSTAKDGYEITPELMESAALLTLQVNKYILDWEGVHQKTTVDKIREIRNRFFPSKKAIATQYPTTETSPFIYFWYFVKWCRILFVRAPLFLLFMRTKSAKNELQHLVTYKRWLNRHIPES